jgi:hypothetical protein
MSAIDWESPATKAQFEDMVCVLLSHLNPEIQRIDGAGGDGGRDAVFPTDDGPEIYQLKRFTGRVNGGRRGQVKSSLKKAAQHDPVAWHLVVPIDPTPKELEWFEGLKSEYQFPLNWDGKTWLNSQMAERAFIPNYFLTDEQDRAFELLRQLKQENAAIENVQAGVKRMRALADRINELDPYYRFDIAIEGGSARVSVFPKYKGAELDRPISVHFALAFPDTSEGHAAATAVEAAMDYGSPVEVEGQFIRSFTIDGPGGLGGTFTEGGSFKLSPAQPSDDWELKVELRAVNPEGVPIATLPITMTERTSGLRGIIVRGSDRPRTIAVEMRTDIETLQMNLHLRFSSNEDHYPYELLPTVGFMQGALPPNRIRMPPFSSSIASSVGYRRR